jgi:uncharacterized protein (DUF488 family)
MIRLVSTIGYEKSGWLEFLARLQSAGIRLVVDVRDFPLSRRAGFSKRQLAAGLAEAGIGYVHLRALGTPPEGREANRRRQWDRFWRIVDARLESAEAEVALQQLAELASRTPSCLLCYEADPKICHRMRVADILAARYGFTIQHLMIRVGSIVHPSRTWLDSADKIAPD